MNLLRSKSLEGFYLVTPVLLIGGYPRTISVVRSIYFFEKFVPTTSTLCVMTQYVPTEYVHSETDGLMLLEIILKVSAALPVHCGQLLMDNIGSTTQM